MNRQKTFLILEVIVSIGFLLLLWSVNAIGLTETHGFARIKAVETMVLGAIFWVVWLSIFPKMWQAMIAALPLYFAWPVDAWTRHSFNSPISSHLIALLFETGPEESWNFAVAYGLQVFVVFTAWTIVYLSVVWIAKRRELAIGPNVRLWMFVLGGFVAGWMTYQAVVNSRADDWSPEMAMDGNPLTGWGAQWETVFPINIASSLAYYRIQRSAILGLSEKIGSGVLHAAQEASSSAPDLVVLVIGESASASHWGALGYSRDTTPNMGKYEGLTLFSNVTALSVATRTAVPNVLSRQPVMWPNGAINLNPEPSFLKAFSEVGYETIWISNQAPLGRHDTSIGIYARAADKSIFVNPSTYEYRSAYDQVLMAPYARTLATQGKKVIVLHLLGSHFDYSHRYPDEFNYFDKNSQAIVNVVGTRGSLKSPVNDAYDNSIRYTDSVLKEILDMAAAKSERAVVAYFSDHGTDPAVGTCASSSAARQSKYAYEVPLFIWMNKAYREVNHEYWRRLQENKDKPFTTRAIYATLLQLAQISIPGLSDSESLLDEPGRHRGARMVSNGAGVLIDFDVVSIQDPCHLSSIK